MGKVVRRALKPRIESNIFRHAGGNIGVSTK